MTNSEMTPTASFPERGEITAAILRVKASMPVIERNVTVPLGGSNSYKTRGMEDILTAAKPLMVDEQIVTYPIHKIDRIEHVTTRNGSRETHWTTVFTESVFVFVCAVDNSRTIVQVIGEGRDSSDKAATKAQVSAHKLAIVQLLELHAGDEPDAERPEAVTEHPQQAPRQQQSSGGQQPRGQSRSRPGSGSGAAPRGQRQGGQQEAPKSPAMAELHRLRPFLEETGLYQALKAWAKDQGYNLDPKAGPIVEAEAETVLNRARGQLEIIAGSPEGPEPDPTDDEREVPGDHDQEPTDEGGPGPAE